MNKFIFFFIKFITINLSLLKLNFQTIFLFILLIWRYLLYFFLELRISFKSIIISSLLKHSLFQNTFCAIIKKFCAESKLEKQFSQHSTLRPYQIINCVNSLSFLFLHYSIEWAIWLLNLNFTLIRHLLNVSL
jgi:hypothetical protein